MVARPAISPPSAKPSGNIAVLMHAVMEPAATPSAPAESARLPKLPALLLGAQSAVREAKMPVPAHSTPHIPITFEAEDPCFRMTDELLRAWAP